MQYSLEPLSFREQTVTVSKRGQLGQDIVAAYEAAHATPQADIED